MVVSLALTWDYGIFFVTHLWFWIITSGPFKISVFSFNLDCLLPLGAYNFSYIFEFLLADFFFRFEVLEENVDPSFCWVEANKASPLTHLTSDPSDNLFVWLESWFCAQLWILRILLAKSLSSYKSSLVLACLN